tara:strand:- start:20 stop:1090 length:1071 start_codon:yes stop_codon:yes gene_type:complete
LKIIDWYIFKAISKMTLIVLFVFASLSGFVDFISQSDDIGIGEYGVYEAVQYTLLKLPSSVFQLIPIIVLIGSLISLGNLSKNNEITVILSSGFSFLRLSISTLLAGLILCFLTITLGEYLSPPMERLADQIRTKNKYNLESIGESKGFWVKEENKIININFVSENNSFGELTIFELGLDGRINKISRASSAGIDDYNQWILSNLSESIFNNTGIESTFSRYKIDKTKLDRDLVSLSVVKSEDLNIIELFKYIEYLESNTLDSGLYKASFHSRLASLFVIPVMCLFALPLSFGFQRSRGAGYRITIGMIIGLAYFIMQNTLMESVQIYSINPVLIGWSPLLLLTVLTMATFKLTRT